MDSRIAVTRSSMPSLDEYVDEIKDAAGNVTTQAVVSQVNHEYTRKTYVAAVVCGVGKNPEMAIKGKKNYPLSLFFVKKVNFHLFSAVFHV